MRKAILISLIIVCALVLGIPLWVFKGYSPDPSRELAVGPEVKLLNVETGQVSTLPLEEYIVGVVAAEMPAEFEEEALKAQAIAARTYTVKRLLAYGAKPADVHPEAELCNDPTHDQAWIDDQEMKQRWGSLKYILYLNKIMRAVKATQGLVITFNNVPIDPVYHGSCGGRGTENSEDVWAAAVPYLRGVDCRLEYKADDQVFTVKTDWSELAAKLEAAGIQASTGAELTGKPILEALKTSARGRIMEASILGQVVTGRRLREVLGLTSTLIEWQQSGTELTIKSTGKGHAVGLCQYGANGMAMAGSDYKAIISHYYTGVQIQKMK
ncbi:MAG: stage II sporulation protein D [Thermincola sp.]|nr:stage II sporulation protein D [Thermincola sp.]MDT3703491.1 stage II sporulation protein D [Thermincola sp.]